MGYNKMDMLKMLKGNRGMVDERGFASLVVGLILVLVLALMTVGFAQLSRHEQQQSLSNLLSTQAYYAAESGINDVVNGIQKNLITAGTPGVNQNTCLPEPLPGTTTQNVNAANDVLYTCAIVGLQTNDLLYKPVNPGGSETALFTTNGPLTDLTLSWGTNDGNTNYAGTDYPNMDFPSTNWGANGKTAYPPLIEFTITPLSSDTRNSMLANQFTFYAYPTNTASGKLLNYNTAPAGQGQIIAGHCKVAVVPYSCGVTLRNIPAVGSAGTGGPYLIHFLDFYDAATVDITGNTGSGPAQFTGAQAIVDVTGKAKNVLKRIQVRVPLSPASNFPDYAVQAKNICKLMESGPTDATLNPKGTTFVAPTGATTTVNPCALDINN